MRMLRLKYVRSPWSRSRTSLASWPTATTSGWRKSATPSSNDEALAARRTFCRDGFERHVASCARLDRRRRGPRRRRRRPATRPSALRRAPRARAASSAATRHALPLPTFSARRRRWAGRACWRCGPTSSLAPKPERDLRELEPAARPVDPDARAARAGDAGDGDLAQAARARRALLAAPRRRRPPRRRARRRRRRCRCARRRPTSSARTRSASAPRASRSAPASARRDARARGPPSRRAARIARARRVDGAVDERAHRASPSACTSVVLEAEVVEDARRRRCRSRRRASRACRRTTASPAGRAAPARASCVRFSRWTSAERRLARDDDERAALLEHHVGRAREERVGDAVRDPRGGPHRARDDDHRVPARRCRSRRAPCSRARPRRRRRSPRAGRRRTRAPRPRARSARRRRRARRRLRARAASARGAVARTARRSRR